ncbi:hypothetical protein TanjilG_07783 [Lupinus angustifolius]|uniref:Uncharacterized protein n=1 Tax=Lupinus angustifolius TaxID=3871 RepID=A0A1J7GVP9_LUPAN|nr:hypothetical protein TanjilG_07783 [Lupinus angustifolius]
MKSLSHDGSLLANLSPVEQSKRLFQGASHSHPINCCKEDDVANSNNNMMDEAFSRDGFDKFNQCMNEVNVAHRQEDVVYEDCGDTTMVGP